MPESSHKQNLAAMLQQQRSRVPARSRKEPTPTTDPAPSAPEPQAHEQAAAEPKKRRTGRLVVSLDPVTAKLLAEFKTNTGQSAAAVLNAALGTESVTEKLRSTWDVPGTIPGLVPQRRRASEPTSSLQLVLAPAGREFIIAAAQEHHAPSTSAFVSLALRLYIESVTQA